MKTLHHHNLLNKNVITAINNSKIIYSVSAMQNCIDMRRVVENDKDRNNQNSCKRLFNFLMVIGVKALKHHNLLNKTVIAAINSSIIIYLVPAVQICNDMRRVVESNKDRNNQNSCKRLFKFAMVIGVQTLKHYNLPNLILINEI